LTNGNLRAGMPSERGNMRTSCARDGPSRIGEITHALRKDAIAISRSDSAVSPIR
jgi:hypothetical protein